MSHYPSQKYLRNLPTPGIVKFVERLTPGDYTTATLWLMWQMSSHHDSLFYGQMSVFRFALKKAGMELTSPRYVRKN